MSIVDITAREILDSRGNPTVEVDLHTEAGVFRAAVPSGASTGIYEACELRDGDEKKFGGKGVSKAVANVVDIIKPKLKGMKVTDQAAIDKIMVEELDGTKNEWGWCKKKLGANAILPVSMAVCRAGAAEKHLPLYKYISSLAGKDHTKTLLPLPCFNVINGGVHSGNKLAVQEFMLMPVGATTFKEAVRFGSETYQTLKSLIKAKYGMSSINVGDEGGFAPDIFEISDALDLLTEAIKTAGHEGKIKIAIDAAASEFWCSEKKCYDLNFKVKDNDKKHCKTSDELVAMYEELVKKYPALCTLEDPFDQDDWESYTKLTEKIGKDIQIIGDDLLVTNTVRIKMGLEKKAVNSLLLKVNQIGSVTEAIEACNLAQSNGWGVLVSHRSGETEDTFIADLTVGLCTGELKSGAPCRTERLAKYNQLIRIEESAGSDAVFTGDNYRSPKL